MKLEILEAAREDLIEGFHFYERSEQGLGEYDLTCLYSDIESLKIFGGIHRRVHKNLHRSLSKRFPFAIYYTVENEIILVHAVLDCRWNPSWIRVRLNEI